MTTTKALLKKPKPGPQRDDGQRDRLLLWNAFQIAYYLPSKRDEALEVLDLARELVESFDKPGPHAARFTHWMEKLNPSGKPT
jgi:hypothetical protein